MRVKDLVHLEFYRWMCKVIFLEEIIAFVNKHCSLHFKVMLHSIYIVLEKVTKMFSVLYPGEWIATKDQWGDVSFVLKERNAFCLAFFRIRIRTKDQVVFAGILLAGVQHLLEGLPGRGQQPIVIAIPYHSIELATHPASISSFSKEGEQTIHVKTIEYCT